MARVGLLGMLGSTDDVPSDPRRCLSIWNYRRIVLFWMLESGLLTCEDGGCIRTFIFFVFTSRLDYLVPTTMRFCAGVNSREGRKYSYCLSVVTE